MEEEEEEEREQQLPVRYILIWDFMEFILIVPVCTRMDQG